MTDPLIEAVSSVSFVCSQVSRTKPKALLLNTTNPGVTNADLFYDQPLVCAPTCRLDLVILSSSGQPAGPGSQQTSSPDYNAWVDLYRQPMAYFNQGAPQTQAPGLQVSSSSSRV